MSGDRGHQDPGDAPVKAVIDALAAEGELESKGTFTVDENEALQKMRLFQLADPDGYVLELVRAAVCKSTGFVGLNVSAAEVRLQFSGTAFSRAVLAGTDSTAGRMDTGDATASDARSALAAMPLWRITVLTPQPLTALWAHDHHFVVAVGRAGTCVIIDNQGPRAVDTGTDADLLAVWGTGPRDVFAVGRGGTVLRYNGQLWQPLVSGTHLTLRCVHGAGPREVYFGGERGGLLRYDGHRCSPAVPKGRSSDVTGGADITSIWAVGPGELFAVCGDHEILHQDHDSWRIIESPGEEDQALLSLFGSSDGTVYVIRSDGLFELASGRRPDRLKPRRKAYCDGGVALDHGELMVLGSLGSVVHFDGSDWQKSLVLNGRWMGSLVAGESGDPFVLAVWMAPLSGKVGGAEIMCHDGVRWRELRISLEGLRRAASQGRIHSVVGTPRQAHRQLRRAQRNLVVGSPPKFVLRLVRADQQASFASLLGDGHLPLKAGF